MITAKEIEALYALARNHAFEDSDSVVIDLLGEIEKLKDTVEDYRSSYERVASDQCPTDERHCGCVPILRQEIAKLKKDVADLCPIGDLAGLPAWQTEKAHMMDEIDNLTKRLRNAEYELKALRMLPDRHEMGG